MIKKIDDFIRQYSLIDKDKELLVGVSGGADSVVLLHILAIMGYRCLVAHVNFCLRGEESEEDMRFVEMMASKLQLPIYTYKVETQNYAHEKGISIEMAAREIRYDFFEQLMRDHNLQCTSVAHHANDDVETFLINLTRGTGLNGLKGISPKNGKIVRPFLCVTRSEILHFADQHHIKYRTDSSNLSDQFVRNKFRNRIIPEFCSINPLFAESVLQTSHYLRDVSVVLKGIIEAWMRDHAEVESNKTVINKSAILQFVAPGVLLFELLHPLGFSSASIHQIEDALKAQPGKQFFSANYRVIIGSEKVIIGSIIGCDSKLYLIDRQCTMIEDPIRLTIKRVEGHSFDLNKCQHNFLFIDEDKISYPLILRRWEIGDWFVPYGSKGRQKLSDYFIDHKFSQDKKEASWLLCSGEEIVWIVDHRNDDRFKVTEQTMRTVVFELL